MAAEGRLEKGYFLVAREGILRIAGKLITNLGIHSFVERRSQNGGDKMREMRSAFVELQPANDAMVG